MGNAFVAGVARSLPAPSGKPAAPGVDDDEWQRAGVTDSSSGYEADGAGASSSYGSQWPSGSTGDASSEDAPATSAYADQPTSGDSAGSGYTSSGPGGSEVEARPDTSQKEEGSGWWPFDDNDDKEPGDDEGDDGSIWDWFDNGDDSKQDPSEQEPAADDRNAEETNDTVITENEDYEGGSGGSMVVSPRASVSTGSSPGSGGFTDGARTGTVPFHGAYQCNYTRMYHSGVPTAFVDGGRSGSTAWAGGGGAGPKGNEASGSYTAVPPVYAARGNWFDKADAWVDSGGTVDVKRSYVTSNLGDQGNGWWVTPLAAARLEQHEQKHVSTAHGNYTSMIDPMLSKVASSATLGKGKMFWKSDAIALLKKTIGWESSLTKFEEQDKNDNGQGGWVDQVDINGGNWPRTVGPQEIEGKVYDKVLLMNSEPDPGKPVQGTSQTPPANP